MSTKEKLNQIKQFILSNDFKSASHLIDKLQNSQEEKSKVKYLKGFLASYSGNQQEGISLIESALAENPSDKEAWVDLGIIYRQASKFEQALEAFTKAHELGVDFITLSNLGDIHFDLQNYDQAIRYYGEAIKLNQNDFSVFFYLGVSLYNTSHYQDAYNVFVKCLELNPNSPKVNLFLGLIFSKHNQNFPAISYLKKELEIDSNNITANLSLGNNLQLIGEPEAATFYYQKGTLSNKTADAYSFLLYIMHHNPKVSDEDLYKVAQEYYKECLIPQIQKINNTPKPRTKINSKIRLGFVSMNFRQASAEFAVLDSFKNFNRDKFELFFYDFCPYNLPEDEITEEYKQIADKWTNIRSKELQEIVDTIRDDEIDILVDLVGHVKGNRLEIFACKPAPIQVSWLHYFGTTGLPEMDWVIANEEAISKEAERHYSERVYRIDGAYVTHKIKAMNIPLKESIAFEKNGYISFGSFNRFSKINSEVLSTWARILSEVKNSKLIFAAKALEEEAMANYINIFFENKGISKDRIIFRPYPEIYEFYRQFNDIDIHLDPFPYNGGTTSFDALYMGTPCINLVGKRWTERFGEIIFKETGCLELTAKSKDEYINKTIELSKDINRLKKYKKELRDKFLNSDFFNYKQLTINLEEAFESMYQDYLSKLGEQ
jgi:protein O-GlcNAc transferase